MTMKQAERNKADAYAGPGQSFPLYSSGAHLRAAWDLAGHAANPAAVRSRILAFAKKHGLAKLLPSTAKGFQPDEDDGDWDDDNVDSAEGTTASNARLDALRALRGPSRDGLGTSLAGTLLPGTPTPRSGRAPKTGTRVTRDSTGGVGGPDIPPATAVKASRTKELLATAYDAAERADGYGAQPAYDGDSRSRVIGFAQEKGLAHHLPERAHNHMHAAGMPHTHKGMADTAHAHTVVKALNVAVKFSTIEKAWAGDDGSCHIEGWVSTEDEDSEHDIVPPECFKAALPGYAQRRMPLSSEHAMKSLPIGHGQHVALVRNGTIFAEASHPTDAADFEHFPGQGTGVYGRYTITDPTHAAQVLKGNIGGFSFVGNLTEYEPLPSGGRRFITLSPWLESTVAAYPVNGKAILLAAKAYEAVLAPAQEYSTVEDTLESLLAGALEAMQREADAAQPVSTISKADLEKMFASLGTKLDAIVEEKVSKATSAAAAQSREGVGRKAPTTEADFREENPGEYIVRKSREVVKAGEELSAEDKALAWGIFEAFIASGMKE